MQHPRVRNLWPDTVNPFSESFNVLTIVLFINCLSWRHKFLMNNALTVEKTNEQRFLIFDLLILAFFGRGELLLCHSELCCLVSGSYSQIHVLSPVMTCLKNFFVIFNAFKKIQAHIPLVFLLFIGENFWDQLGTNFLHLQFEIKISWMVW